MFRRARKIRGLSQAVRFHLSMAQFWEKWGMTVLEPCFVVAQQDWEDSEQGLLYADMPASSLGWLILNAALFPWPCFRCIILHGQTQFYTTSGHIVAAVAPWRKHEKEHNEN